MAIDPDPYLARSGEIVDRCVEIDRAIATLEAEKAGLLGERVELLLGEIRPGADGFEAAERSMFAEVSAALHVTRAAASRALGTGWALRDRFPGTLAALRAGQISARHAAVIVAAATPLGLVDRDAHQRFEEQVLPYAAAETAPRTGAYAKSVAAAIAPESVTERCRRAHDDRRVFVTDHDNGQSLFGVLLPTPLAHAAYERSTAMARRIREITAATDCGGFNGPHAPQPGRTPTDQDLERITGFTSIVAESGEQLSNDRTLDQIRADIATDLLLTGTADTLTGLADIRGTVQVTIAATTLTGADDRPTEHDGHGPIDRAIARALAADATEWDRLFLDPRGMLVHTDTYAPTERMRRFLRARDRHCRFPGCRIPARACQIDHNHDHAKGGKTELCNLCCFCVGHHTLKHPDLDDRWRWTAVQGPGGIVTWTSPTGRTYTDTPPPRVQFI
jgi:hypothetical protein